MADSVWKGRSRLQTGGKAGERRGGSNNGTPGITGMRYARRSAFQLPDSDAARLMMDEATRESYAAASTLGIPEPRDTFTHLHTCTHILN
ncbi:Uncharacterized protein DAT39_007363 [Clarias magur]|uniref:Uncharacterized protein n=1 Tax=Clarias magur TaxID=1594786 RepID=A0A8J4UK77_CLAMG|nr:Uncharacterized protein DAT39_007363 [Clarias magur]